MSSKLCFLTVGATASFSALIEAAVSPAFLTALDSQGYTELSVQYGQDGKQLFEKCKSVAQGSSKLKVTGFDLDRAGLGRHMRRAKGVKDAVEGVVISHAGMRRLHATKMNAQNRFLMRTLGSGSILDALRTGVPIIVVPNETLLDNHQVELAEALAEQEYVVHGRLAQLPQALADAEKLRQRSLEWPPVNSGPERGLKGVMDDEMGFLD
jgi:beta-1,4-N-acetylglucosaminyltransferase